MSREINILVKIEQIGAAALKSVRGELQGLQKDIGRGFANAGRNIERGIGIGVAAAAGGLAYAVKQAGDFEAALNTINTVAGLSAQDLTAVGDSLRKMARTTGTSLDELTAGYYDLVSAGISAKDAQNVLTNANTLAIGGLASTAETIDLLTTAINSYGGDASRATEFTNMFAESIAAGKVTASELAASFAQIGPIAAQQGIELEELAAAYAVMTATGVPAAEASTQMRSAIVALQRPTAELEALQKDLNVNFLELAQEKGLAFAYNEMTKAADEAGIQMIELTGRVEGANFAAIVAGDNYEGYAAELEKVRKSSDGVGVAQQQANERMKGLNFQLARIKEQARDAAIIIGEAVIPKLIPLLEKASTWIEAHRDDVAKFAENVAAAVERGIAWASSLDWEGIGRSLEMAANFGKSLVETFLSMPDWVKQAVITGWGLNKLTGGALGSIIGTLGSGLIKGVLNMNAGVVNVKGGVVNGGPGAGVGAAARGGGLWTKAGAAAFWLVGVPMLAAELGQVLHDVGVRNPFVDDEHPYAGTIYDPIDPKTGKPYTQGGTPPAPTGSGSAAGGGFGSSTAADGSFDRFGSKLDKLATNEVIEHLSRTTEMGLAGIGTSVEQGITSGMDPVGDIATAILKRAENPKAPEIMGEIQGHLAGLEEIQQTYLNQGDIKLAQKVQANIDALHQLIGTEDQTRSVTQAMAAQAASSDVAMLNSARAQTDAVHATNATIAGKNFSPTVNVAVTNNISVQEWQRVTVANLRASTGSGGFI